MPSVELSKLPGISAARALSASDRAQIEALLAEMEQVRVLLDTPPLSDPGG